MNVENQFKFQWKCKSIGNQDKTYFIFHKTCGKDFLKDIILFDIAENYYKLVINIMIELREWNNQHKVNFVENIIIIEQNEISKFRQEEWLLQE